MVEAIAGIFGINFEQIPTAHQPWGFAAALVLMGRSAVAYQTFLNGNAAIEQTLAHRL